MATPQDIETLPEGLKIVYVAVDSESEKVLYAAWDKTNFRNLADHDRSLSHRTVSTQTINVASVRAQALAKLNGVERLALNLPDWIEEGQSKFPVPAKTRR